MGHRIVLAVLVPLSLAACASLDAGRGGAPAVGLAPASLTAEAKLGIDPEPETLAARPATSGLELAVRPAAEPMLEAAPGPEPHPVTAPHPRWDSQPRDATSETADLTSTPASPPQAGEVATEPIPEPPFPPPPVLTQAPPESSAPAPASRRAEDSAEGANLWERVRRGFALPDLTGHRVRASERWYAARPDYVQRTMERASRYLFHIVQEVERRGLPTELALLPFVESAFNPEALSSARASGIWQFIPSTGRNFDLAQNIFRDDRRDVLASTAAALDYLQALHRMFGDWHLALAAYNWGEGNVARAIDRNRKARRSTHYSNLRMPRETQSYVPKLQAVKNIVARPDVFGLALPEIADRPYFLSLPIESDIDVGLAASLAGVSVEDFRALNPQMNKPVILAAGTPRVQLPYAQADRFVHALARHPGPLASWTAWVAPRTLTPAKAAEHVGMSEDDLRKVNAIPLRRLIQIGSTLLVPRRDDHHADISEHMADNGRMILVPDRVRPRAKRRR